jgi:hypothetical protein
VPFEIGHAGNALPAPADFLEDDDGYGKIQGISGTV